jgi:RibD domain-containing protein
MATVIAGMTTSVDGFVADSNGSAEPLYTDLDDLRRSPYMQVLIEETGAVVMGRRAFEMGDPDSYADNYEFHTFVTDGVASAIHQAKRAAGDKNVQVVGGASVVQQLLRGGLVDELRVEVMPVVLGGAP